MCCCWLFGGVSCVVAVCALSLLVVRYSLFVVLSSVVCCRSLCVVRCALCVDCCSLGSLSVVWCCL